MEITRTNGEWHDFQHSGRCWQMVSPWISVLMWFSAWWLAHACARSIISIFSVGIRKARLMFMSWQWHIRNVHSTGHFSRMQLCVRCSVLLTFALARSSDRTTHVSDIFDDGMLKLRLARQSHPLKFEFKYDSTWWSETNDKCHQQLLDVVVVIGLERLDLLFVGSKSSPMPDPKCIGYCPLLLSEIVLIISLFHFQWHLDECDSQSLSDQPDPGWHCCPLATTAGRIAPDASSQGVKPIAQQCSAAFGVRGLQIGTDWRCQQLII